MRLVIERGLNKTRFTWWCEPPEIWKLLGDLSKRLLASASAVSMIESQQTDTRKRLVKQLNERLDESHARRQKEQAESLIAHNRRCYEMELSLKATGLTCPFCNRYSKDIRFIDRGPEAASYFICKGCGRSFRPGDFQSA